MANQKEFAKIGVTKATNDALELFIDCVDLRLFNKNLRKVFHFYLMGMIYDGWIIDETDLPLIKQIFLLFELTDTLEQEYAPD